MRSKSAPLLLGFVLLTLSALAGWRMVQGWTSAQQQQESTAGNGAADPSFDPTTGDPGIAEASKEHLYGLLAHSPATPTAHDEAPAKDGPAAGQSRPAAVWDRVHTSAPLSQRLLHQRFSVRSYRQFEFVVPEHAARPRLEGTFEVAEGAAGRESANVDVLLLTDEEFKDFLSGDMSFRFATNPSSSGEISWLLNPTFAASQKYHLVFHHSSGASGTERVDADFTLDVR